MRTLAAAISSYPRTAVGPTVALSGYWSQSIAHDLQENGDPVLDLDGGPGDIAPLETHGILAADFIRDRDIWVVSQRGTWFSKPALTCAATNEFA